MKHVLSLFFAKNEGYKCKSRIGNQQNPILAAADPSSQQIRRHFILIKMTVKIAIIFVFLGICYALPVDDHKPTAVPPVPPVPEPIELTQVKPGLPQPLKPGSPDLNTDASTWWHSWWHHDYPVYYPVIQSVPTYTHWHTHW
ncbi:unnamed protein product [Chrysodeixis includens]|uniref:Uncharacterized protein n=1 Tax=Chrysodeixis includens TaxID=689277 RepID=A0A9P0BTJ0_CHRIL|nr:unnamed protein product [Chrysodeixis includens]